MTVSNLASLENLHCAKSQLTELNIDNCPNLKVLDCSYNDLTELDLSNLKQLKQLNIRNNNFSEQDLKLLPNISESSEIKQLVNNSQYEVVLFFLHGLGASAIELA